MDFLLHPNSFLILLSLFLLCVVVIVILYKVLQSISGQLSAEEIKNAEKIFRQNQEIETLLDSSPVMIYYKDRENRLIRVNKTFSDFIGKSRSRIEGRSEFDLFPEMADKYWHDDMKIISTGNPKKNMIEKVPTRSGERWVQTDKFPVKDANDMVTGIMGFSVDITDRKRAADQLRKDRTKFQTLFESVFDAIFLETLDGRIVDCNKAAEKMLGYSKQELLSMKTSDIVPKEVSDGFSEMVSTITREGEYYGESVNLRKTGEKVPVDVSIKLINLDNREYVFTVVRDITQRKAFEKALIESERKYKELAESSHDFIFTVDKDGFVKYVNEFGAKQFGKDHSELIGKNIASIFPEDVSKKQLDNIRSVIKSGNSLYTQSLTRFPYKDLWLDTWLIPLRNDNGDVENVLGISRDVTDGKKAEEKLSESEERYRTVISSLPDAIVIYKDGKITFANHALLDKYGFSKEDVIGMELVEFVYEKYRGQVSDNILKRRRGDVVSEYEIEIVSKDGRRVPVIVKGVPIKYDKEPATLLVLTDITEKKLAEEKILQLNERLEKEKDVAVAASKAKSDFIANMSHGIRTPMSAIISASEILSGTRLTEKQKKCVQALSYAGENLLGMVNNVLDLSKIESGHFLLDRKEFNIRGLLLRTVEMLGYSAKEKGLNISLEVAADVRELVISDPARLQEILINMIGNAIKFTDKGSVSVNVSNHYGSSDMLLFSVQDTGIGIPQNKTLEIFEKFNQMDVDITHKYSGTGLGLTISKHLVELMGGKIWVESVLNKGSTFFFTIKLADKQKRSMKDIGFTGVESQEDVIRSAGKAIRLLFVEDSEPLRFLFKEYFKGIKEVKTDFAEDGAKSLALFNKNSYDMIFMDLKIPVINGYQATRTIRETEKKLGRPRTTIIAISAFALPEEIDRSIDAGCDGHLTKPIMKKDLLAFIIKHLY